MPTKPKRKYKTNDHRTTAQKNRAIRRKALREQLQNQGHLNYALSIVKKLEDKRILMDPIMVHRYKTALDARFKIIAKYLPDLKSIEHTGEDGETLTVKIIRFGDDTDSS